MLAAFHPAVREWFEETFPGGPTAPQRSAWEAIGRGRDVLVAAPTGSGKTLAAFLAALDDLVTESTTGRLEGGTCVVYVSPLKALGSDIEKNLSRPLAEIRERLTRAGAPGPQIRVSVRSGDTTAAERALQKRQPPHILITTPESLYILLTAAGSRAHLSKVKTVIVDEIHAVAGDKRGAHLALSLERLDHLIKSAGGPPPRRIGLSATQEPIELVARLLVGTARDLPEIVNAGLRKDLDLAIETPLGLLGPIASNEMISEVYDRVAELARAHKSTLVFVNTRRLVERGAHALAARLGEDRVAAHHGSLSKEIRLSAEQRLKAGQLSAVVATASLELGIDIGDVDLVVQIGSPRSISTLLQRVGRSGHALSKTPKGRLFALTRDQLIETAALVRAARRGRLDQIALRDAPLDILAQQVVATVASSDELHEGEILDLVRRAAPYSDLTERDFQEVLEILSEGLVPNRSKQTTHLARDRVNEKLRPRRGARLAAITSGGAIPDTASYAVLAAPEDIRVGTLDEDFAIESSAGDVFLLGNTSWRVRRIEKGVVRVEDAHGAAPTVPFWNGEAPARTRELSDEVGKLRAEIEQKVELPTSEVVGWLSAETSMPTEAATQVVEYLTDSRRVLGALPTSKRIIAERFFDEAGGMQLVIHSPFGGRINRAFGLALRKKFCRTFDIELQAAATDDGLIISLGEKHSFPLESVFSMLSSDTLEDTLTQALLTTPFFGTRWRWNLVRSLMLLRHKGGQRVAPQILRMKSEDLLGAVFPDQVACFENLSGPVEVPNHPLVRETLKDCLTEVFDLEGLAEIVRAIEKGEVEVRAVDTPEPSQLSHEIISANPYAFLDDAPLEERRTRAVTLRRSLPGDLAGTLGALDADAIRTVTDDLALAFRDSEDLFDALTTLVVMRPREDLTPFFQALVAARRAVVATIAEQPFWVASEKAEIVASAFAEASVSAGTVLDLSFAPEPPPLPPLLLAAPIVERRSDRPIPSYLSCPTSSVGRGYESAIAIVRGHLDVSGPRTEASLAETTGLDRATIEVALLGLEANGVVIRGRFTPGSSDLEWCDRRVLARIHRLTVLPPEEEAHEVCWTDGIDFLPELRDVAEGTKLGKKAGVKAVLEQLAGFEVPASAWESEVLSVRTREYEPEWLDALCYSGEMAFGRVERTAYAEGVKATRAVPVAFFPRETMDEWLRSPARARRAPEMSNPSDFASAVFERLTARGAAFPQELARALGVSRSEVDSGLLELFMRGEITADGFGSLRPKAASTDARQRRARAPAPTGRWSILDRPDGAKDASTFARNLLARWGVLFRDLLARETGLPPWRELIYELRRMEARGEIRGGRFVSGFVGEQFALPEAVEGLRAVRRNRSEDPELIRVSAVDPLNLAGITSPGARVPAVGDNAVLYGRGVPLASREVGVLNIRAPLPAGLELDPTLAARRRPPAAKPTQRPPPNQARS